MKNSKNLIFIGLLILVLVFAYFFLFGDNNDEALSIGSARESEVVGNELLAQLQQLEGIKLDATLFADPLFQSLTNETVMVQQEPIGRINPFAPLPGSN